MTTLSILALIALIAFAIRQASQPVMAALPDADADDARHSQYMANVRAHFDRYANVDEALAAGRKDAKQVVERLEALARAVTPSCQCDVPRPVRYCEATVASRFDWVVGRWVEWVVIDPDESTLRVECGQCGCPTKDPLAS